jgi:hypothetical protein
MKKLLAFMLFGLTLGLATPAHAETPGLQVNPLQYEDTLTTSAVKLGYIEVANPSDTTISLQANVQGFRQAGTDGRLSFFDDAEISDGIKVDLPKFNLGPREAIRVAFSVDPAKLPKGGVYAVIFFRTIPPTQSSNSSYVSESANIGTLLLLQNGATGAHIGEISRLDVPFWQFGRGLTGGLNYRNTDRSKTAVGFKPSLTIRVLPWGKAGTFSTGLVLPASERIFRFDRTGSYFGFLPVTLTDTDSGHHATRWVFALTGWYQWLVLTLLVFVIVVLLVRPRLITGLMRRRPKH